MHINRFLKSHLDSMSRTNNFEVEIHGPNGIRSRGMRCTQITMPAKTIGTKQHKVLGSGPPKHYLTDVQYAEEISLTFMLDNTFEDRQIMERWQSLMYDQVYNLSYPYQYHGSMTITQLARDGLPNYEVELHKAFPSAIGEIAFDSGGEGSMVQSFTVTFKYRTWTTSYENSPSGLLGGLFKKYSRKLQSRVKNKIEDIGFG